MALHPMINRRAAIADLGRAGLAIMVFGAAACSDNGSGTSSSLGTGETSSTAGAGDTISTRGTEPEGTTSTTGATSSTVAFTDHTSWHRVVLGGVSAYILYRDGEGALVDTGNPGNEGDIGAALDEVGLGWDSIGHVIVTHKHGDHVGSAEAIAGLAPGASFYAGDQDARWVNVPVAPTIVGDRDSVFDLNIVETPGHTPGHLSVHDPASGILVAGDSMNGAGSGVQGSDSGVGGANPRFSENMLDANDSIRKMAQLNFEVVLFGHGEPLLEGGTSAVQSLAATLPDL